MSKLPTLSGHELIKILSKLGFEVKRQKGSHVVLVRETQSDKSGCVVPLHPELKAGTLIGILKQINLSREEFLKLIDE